jgi:hypothetical protein
MEMDATASDKKDGRDLRRVLTTISEPSIIVAGVIGTGVFILLGNCFWREGLEGAFGPERREVTFENPLRTVSSI